MAYSNNNTGNKLSVMKKMSVVSIYTKTKSCEYKSSHCCLDAVEVNLLSFDTDFSWSRIWSLMFWSCHGFDEVV